MLTKRFLRPTNTSTKTVTSLLLQKILNEYVRMKDIGSVLKVEIKDSLVPKAGLGVFAKCKIPSDEIVTFYPGNYFPPPPIWTVVSPTGEPVISLCRNTDSAYAIHCRTNGGYIDGQNSPMNEWACGHLINHPPRNAKANVKVIDFKWDDIKSNGDHININKIGEGYWYVDPVDASCVNLKSYTSTIVGLVFITKRDLQDGEELYFDYQLEAAKQPAWYHPVIDKL